MRPELDDTLAAPATPVTPDRTTTAVAAASPVVPAGGLPAGRQLGHFRIEHLLGAGGMGEVYLATDLALDRPVAVKVLPEQLARDPRRRERLIREARAQARVAHPNVGHMYFIGEDADRLYFAMEFVPGETLADRIAKGPMAVGDALAAIRDAVLGLREAQRSGITHRDVKPSNLMVDGHGHVKVLDFGLAAGDLESAREGPIAQTSLAGTPLYMAPEQARGEPVDHRTDIYALGGTLYHLIAGKPPFQADSVEELVSAHATAARPALPRRGQPRTQIGAIDTLVARMMAAHPQDRFATYDDLLRAIDLASVTRTRPGGFLARSIAMVIDVLVTGLAILLVRGLIAAFLGGDVNVADDVFLPVLAVYHTLAIARWKTTIGKGLMELEIVDVETGERPTLARSARRALAMLGFPIAVPWIGRGLVAIGVPVARDAASIMSGLWIAFGMLALAYAAARISGKRAVWDRVARSMVRYRTERATLGSDRP